MDRRTPCQMRGQPSGAHLWAATYERSFSPDTVFELQDDLASRIVSTVADLHGILPRSLSELVRSRSPEDLSPYEAVLRSPAGSLADACDVGGPKQRRRKFDFYRSGRRQSPRRIYKLQILCNGDRPHHAHEFGDSREGRRRSATTVADRPKPATRYLVIPSGLR